MKIPRILGRYEVVDLIGQGGMGALYRARDPRIGRYVAIKLLRPGYDTPELRDRFSREAAAAGGLSHPNIVTIYDVGEQDGLPFIAMEYVRGETFADLVGLRPPLSVLRKVQLMEEVCAGLAHAHEAGIVHRDIKPANLIVGPEGTVKILDFGIAKLIARPGSPCRARSWGLELHVPRAGQGHTGRRPGRHLLGRGGVVRAAVASTGISGPGAGRGAAPDPARRSDADHASTAPTSTGGWCSWSSRRSRRIRI